MSESKEMTCPVCHGLQRVQRKDNWEWCSFCKGKGSIGTSRGGRLDFSPPHYMGKMVYCKPKEFKKI